MLVLVPGVVTAQSVVTITSLDTIAAGLGTQPSAVTFWEAPNGNQYIAVGYNIDPEISIVQWINGNLAIIADGAAGLLPGAVNGIFSWQAVSPKEDRIIAVAHTTTPFVTILRWDESAQQVISEATDPAPPVHTDSRALDVVAWPSTVPGIVAVVAANDSGAVNSSTDVYRFVEGGATPFAFVMDTVVGSNNPDQLDFMPIPDGQRTSSSIITTERMHVITGGFRTSVGMWPDRPGAKANALVMTHDIPLSAPYFISTYVYLAPDDANSLATLGSANTPIIEGGFTVSRIDYSLEAVPSGGILAQLSHTDNAFDEIDAFKSFTFDDLSGRIVVIAYGNLTKKLDIRRWLESSGSGVLAEEFPLLDTITLTAGRPRDVALLKQDANTMLLVAANGVGLGVELFSISLAGDVGVVVKGDEDFLTSLFGLIGLDLVSGAGAFLALIVVAVYTVQGNFLVALAISLVALIYFLIAGLIAPWVVIPFIFMGVFGLYKTFREALG